MHKLTSQDPETQSLDLVADNIAKLTALFPEILTEGADGSKRLDFAALRELLGDAVEDKEERYNFTWHGKAQARRLAQTPSLGTLRPCPTESKHWDNTQNLFIEGDNLEVLKLLQKSYHQRVKMIYIDPPYNTGKDFIYPDNYRDNIANYLELTGQSDSGRKMGTNTETSGRYHTNWLNMMYPRLKLARNLLREDGVIFISIDDTEVANLRKLCDEIFGEENFMACFTWQRRKMADSRNENRVSTDHEYTLCYGKTLASQFKGNDIDKTKYSNPDNDPRGDWFSADLTGVANQSERPNLHYDLVNPLTSIKYPPSPTRGWAYARETMAQFIAENKILWPKSPDGRPRMKKFLKEITRDRTGFSSWLSVGQTAEGTRIIQELFDEKIFPFSKPVSLLTTLLNQATEMLAPDLSTPEDSAIVLDFFAGSGTTAHAVMALNAEDGGNRQFIMVQLPEPTDKPDYPTIADIGKERIRRAGEKIRADKGGIINLDVGFKVFKLDSTNIKPWDVAFDTLEQDMLTYADSIKPDRHADDVLYEILLKYGLDLSLPITPYTLSGNTVYSIGMGALVVCLDHTITLETVEGIANLKNELQPESAMRVVFRDSGFADDVVKVNAVQILKQAGIDDVRSV